MLNIDAKLLVDKYIHCVQKSLEEKNYEWLNYLSGLIENKELYNLLPIKERDIEVRKMKVQSYSYKNRKEINDIYIHDNYFNNINIDLNSKKIYITLEGEYIEGKSCIIIFENIIHFECNRLDLWGGEENRILGIYLGNDDDIDKYINYKVEKEQEKVSHKIKFEKNKSKFINICIQTNTGDITNIMIFIYRY